MRIFVASLLIVPALTVMSAASSPGIAEAVRTGEIIGGAMACGVPQGRILSVARSVTRRISELAQSPDEIRQARTFHEDAVKRASERIKAGEGDCGEAVHSFDRLEAEQR